MAWGIEQLDLRDTASLKLRAEQTLRGEIAGFRIPGFATRAQCEGLSRFFIAEHARVDSYTDSNVSAGYLGVPAIKYGASPEAYFAAARDWNIWQAEATTRGAAWDAAAEVAGLLARALAGYACGVASDPEAGRYFHGIIRRIARSPLHNDFAQRDFPGWIIGQCQQQLAWNVYLTGAAKGEGETIIYRKLWAPADEAFKKRHEMGYEDGVVAGAECAHYLPVEGELMVFNCVNYHEVTHSEGPRLTTGGFVGLDHLRRLAWFWS